MTKPPSDTKIRAVDLIPRRSRSLAKTILRRSFWTIFSLIFLVTASLVVSVGALRSEWGSRHLLSYARVFLKEKMNTELQFDEGRIDFLTGLHFKNLKIVKNDEATQFTIEIPEIDLQYSIAFLRRRLEVYNFTLTRAKMVYHQVTPTIAPAVVPIRQTVGSPLDKLEQFIINPPAELLFDKVQIEDLNLDAEMRTATTRKKILLPQLNLHAKLEMVQERLAASGDLSMSAANQFESDTRASRVAGRAEEGAHVKSGFSAGGQWSLDVHREGQGWLYRFETNGLKASLANFEMFENVGHQSSSTRFADADFDLESNSLLHSKKLLKLDQSSVETMKVTLRGATSEVLLEQGPTPTSLLQKNFSQRTSLGPQKISFQTSLAENLNFEFQIDSEKLQKPPTVTLPVSFSALVKGSVPRSIDRVDADAQVDLAGSRLLAAKLHLGLSDEQINFTGQGHLSVEKTHVKALPSLQKFPAGLVMDFAFDGKRSSIGDVESKFKMTAPALVMMPLPQSSNLSVEGGLHWHAREKTLDYDGSVALANPVDGSWNFAPKFSADLARAPKIKGDASIAQLAQPAPGGPPLVLQEPMRLTYDVDLDPKVGHAELKAELPAAEIPGKAKLDGTVVTIRIASPDLNAASDLRIDFDLKQAGMKIDPRLSGGLPQAAPYRDLKASAKAQLIDKRRFVLEQLTFSMNGQQVALDTQASGDLQDKTLQAQSTLSLQMGDDFPDLNGQRIRGQVKIPVTINVLRGQQISLAGEMILKNVSWKKGELAASGISGKVPFSEKLKWDGTHVRFETLVTQNPFERVDFDRVRPLLQSTESLKIEQVSWIEKNYGPFVGFFSLDQNMIFAHQFDMDLISGKLYGELFIDTYPSSLQFGLLARMTGLDLGEILPKKFLDKVPDGAKPISGRAGFVLNLNRSTMDGRIDVTEIGGPQLITAINVIDPLYEDPKMNKMREVLEVGYPTSVEFAFAEGYMNIDIGLSILGVSNHESAYGIRISGLLAKSTQGFLKTAEKGPLE